MTAPIGRIPSQRTVKREDGSDGHANVANKLDPRATPPKNKKVDEVSKMYERQFLGEMFKAMRSTVSETDKPSMAQNIYNSQRDEQYIDAWSEQGGIGFSNIIYDQIMERFFGQTAQGAALKKQGMIALTDRDISKVSEVKDGVTTPVVPASSASLAGSEKRTVENTEPMPAPTPPRINDSRTESERVAAGELFPADATKTMKAERGTASEAPSETYSPAAPSQTALKIEVSPSPTGAPAKIQAPWDATVLRMQRIEGAKTAVTLEHGPGLRSTLVFDGIVGASLKLGEKIPKGQTVGTMNADSKSFLWNLATTAGPEGHRE